MRLLCLAVGKSRRGPESALADHYLDRARKAGHGLALRPIDMVEISESSRLSIEERRREEAASAFAFIPSGAATIALDERGDLLSSADFAADLARRRDMGVPALVYLIGGPDGLSDDARGSASRLVSFGRTTWPHLLMRALLFEQIYRAATILSGHPYHRG